MTILSQLRLSLKRVLAEFGYRIQRVDPRESVSIGDYLCKLQEESRLSLSAVCFDNEIGLQTDVLSIFSRYKATFVSPVCLASSRAPVAGTALPPAPACPFISVIDCESFSLPELLQSCPWLIGAQYILVATRAGSCHSDRIDLLQVTSLLFDGGFHLQDVVTSSCTSLFDSESARLFFVYKSNQWARGLTVDERYRVNRALAHFASPVVTRCDFRLLAGRGSFGYSDGVLNPGAIVYNEQIYLLPRSDQTPWALQKEDESLFFASSRPLLLRLNADHNVADGTELATEGYPNAVASRIGDFRLFKSQDRLFTNHFVIARQSGEISKGRPTCVDRMVTRVGLSEVEIDKRQLTWRGFPSLDRPLASAEKNWAMFTDNCRLLLLYSFSPYVLLEALEWPDLAFTTVLEEQISVPFDGDGLPLRNSINPVDYDDEHWLHIVHKVYPTKRYVFFAVLISKETLRPVQVTARPLVCGWQSSWASIVYTCAATVDQTHVSLFSGLDDSATAVARIPRERLDAEWVSVTPEKEQQAVLPGEDERSLSATSRSPSSSFR